MGASSSTEQVPADQREAEEIAASTGALPMLQNVFSLLADSESKAIPLSSLQQCFSVAYKSSSDEASMTHSSFPGLLDSLGSSIVDLFFVAEKGGVNWIQFLRGYVKCCGRSAASASLNNVLRVFDAAATKAGYPSKLQFEIDDNETKASGFLMPYDVLMLLWICWIMSSDSRSLKSLEMKADYGLPDLSPLVLSAVVSCAEVGANLNVWDCDISGLDVQLPLGKIHVWAIKTVPSLPDCFAQFVNAKLKRSLTSKDEGEQSSALLCDSSATMSSTHLLTYGRAWAISLTLRSSMSEEILKACFPGNGDEINGNLLYQSSIHGKGMNRFWSNVDGYNGPVLILLSANLEDANANMRKQIIGALSQQGFENRETFYGNSGSLYAISPVFHVYPAHGKDKNFLYSHLHPSGRAYDPHPKPVGIAFGGSTGNERIFIDEDFSRVTIRHHAVDKTYQHGPLIHDQGFLPVEAAVIEVEVWGLAGRKAKDIQTLYKKREELFTEQRRTVDLKTFSNWEDSPEKMMMDMMSNPNAIRKEDR